ncbi:MAG: hypothetical protein ACFFD4_01905 [Candidatus Odinarchaeota archaeon]
MNSKRLINRFFLLFMLIFFVNAPISAIAAQDDLTLGNDRLTVKFEGNNPHIKFFLNKNENSSKSHYKLIFGSLVEYSDSDSDGIYTSGKDGHVQTISLESIDFDHTGPDSTADDGVTVTFNSSGFNQNMPDLSVLIRIYFFKQTQELYITGTDTSGVTSIETVTVQGNAEFKFDIEIRNWDFDVENNRLALIIKILANTAFQHRGGDNETDTSNTIESKNNRERPYIEYPGTALADGEIVDVAAKLEEKGQQHQVLQFSFPSFSEELIYDPVLGIDGIAGVDAAGILILAAVFPVLYFYRRKKR